MRNKIHKQLFSDQQGKLSTYPLMWKIKIVHGRTIINMAWRGVESAHVKELHYLMKLYLESLEI